MRQTTLELQTLGRALYRFDPQVNDWLDRGQVGAGLCHVFIQHTSASLIITENADPDVHKDLEMWMSDAVIDGDPRFAHDAEGPDDMSAHIRSVLTHTSINLPVMHGKLALGTWQGLYLWEHRSHPQMRKIVLTLV